MTGHPTWPLDNVVSLALLGTCSGQQIANVLHFQQVSGTQDPAGAAAFCDALAADWETNVKASWQPLHPAGYTLNTIRATPVAISGLAHPSLASHDRNVSTGNVGSGGVTDDMSTAQEIKLRTLEGGKSHRGRIYIGPIPAQVVTNGVFQNAGYTAAVNAFITAMGRYLTGGAFVATGQLVVFSRPIHLGAQQWTRRIGGTLTVRSNPTARVGDATPVTAMIIDTTARVQRRRELGVGA